VNKKLGQNLLALSGIDEKIQNFLNQKKEVQSKLEIFASEINYRRDRLKECEAAHKEGTLRQVLEAHRLRDEEQKIVERRKKLGELGGARVAKLLEREIDIASRSLHVMEERALKAVEEVDQIGGQLDQLKEDLLKLEQQFESDNQGFEKQIAEFDENIKELSGERNTYFKVLDDRLARLYERVRTRLGSPVAVASAGACRSCYRALPAQTYNQILAGNMLIQCPGCSRLLVYVEATGK